MAFRLTNLSAASQSRTLIASNMALTVLTTNAITIVCVAPSRGISATPVVSIVAELIRVHRGVVGESLPSSWKIKDWLNDPRRKSK